MKQKLDKLLRAHPPIRFVVDVVDVYFSKCVSRAAAELAYFLILTFFPIMICISAFVNELRLDLSSLMDHADPLDVYKRQPYSLRPRPRERRSTHPHPHR